MATANTEQLKPAVQSHFRFKALRINGGQELIYMDGRLAVPNPGIYTHCWRAGFGVSLIGTDYFLALAFIAAIVVANCLGLDAKKALTGGNF